jgi:AcrR family transcriptional regulator
MADIATASARRQDRNRRAILDAALALIEESGVDGWSMRELAGRVDYTAGALYRYFDGKAALLTALTAEAMQNLGERLNACRSTEGPLGLLEELGLAYLGFAAAEPTLFRLAFIQTPSRRDSLSRAPATASPYAVVLSAVRTGVEEGQVTVTESFSEESVAFTFWSAVHGMAVLELTHLRDFDADFGTVHHEALRRIVCGLATPAS